MLQLCCHICLCLKGVGAGVVAGFARAILINPVPRDRVGWLNA